MPTIGNQIRLHTDNPVCKFQYEFLLLNPVWGVMGSVENIPARVTDRGRVTIPADEREELGLSKGDHVLLDIQTLSSGRSEMEVDDE